jgi:hypothetical protein
VPTFTESQLRQRATAAAFIIDKVQCVDCLVDSANFRQRQWGCSIADLQGTHDTGRRHPSKLERTDQAQHIIPVWFDGSSLT